MGDVEMFGSAVQYTIFLHQKLFAASWYGEQQETPSEHKT